MSTNRSPALLAELLNAADQQVDMAGKMFVLGKNREGKFRRGKLYLGGKEVTREDFMNRTVDDEIGAKNQPGNQPQDDRNLWQKMMPSFLGGKDAPKQDATPAPSNVPLTAPPPSTQPKPAGSAVPPTPTAGAAVAEASINKDKAQPGQAPGASITQPAAQVSGYTAPTNKIDPNEPGPVEPADAIERYNKLFGIN